MMDQVPSLHDQYYSNSAKGHFLWSRKWGEGTSKRPQNLFKAAHTDRENHMDEKR